MLFATQSNAENLWHLVIKTESEAALGVATVNSSTQDYAGILYPIGNALRENANLYISKEPSVLRKMKLNRQTPSQQARTDQPLFRSYADVLQQPVQHSAQQTTGVTSFIPGPPQVPDFSDIMRQIQDKLYA